MNINYSALLEGIGATCPKDFTSFEIPSRCGLYVDMQILSNFSLCAGSRLATGFLRMKFGDKGGAVVKQLAGALDEFMSNRQAQARLTLLDGVLMANCSWAERYQFRSAMIEFTESQAFRSIVWPFMARDFERDERQLNSIHLQSRSGIFAYVAAQFAKSERAWAFSHFNLTQRRRDAGFSWIIDVGEELHLIEVIEKLWSRQVASGMMSAVVLSTGVVNASAENAPTWISETIEFRANDFSTTAIREFSNYLKNFVNSIYLGTVDDFPVTGPRMSSHAALLTA